MPPQRREAIFSVFVHKNFFLDDESEISQDNQYQYKSDDLFVGIKEISIPVYLHLKTYFSKKRRCIPFFAMSPGYRAASKKVLHFGLDLDGEAVPQLSRDYENSSVSIDYGMKGG